MGVVSDDGGLQLMKKTGEKKFQNLEHSKERCTLRKMRGKNLDSWLGFIERCTDMRR